MSNTSLFWHVCASVMVLLGTFLWMYHQRKEQLDTAHPTGRILRALASTSDAQQIKWLQYVEQATTIGVACVWILHIWVPADSLVALAVIVICMAIKWAAVERQAVLVRKHYRPRLYSVK